MIGGFLELELADKKSYHPEALALNTGRNCLVYLFQARNIKKLHLPHYICDSVITTAREHEIDIQFYTLNEDFTPNLDQYTNQSNEYILYVNYFGACEEIVNTLIEKGLHLIIDNNHAFYSSPHSGVDTFYSPRKFFGVPDGGYLYTNVSPSFELEQDMSSDRFTHLLNRIDKGFVASYHDYEENEVRLDHVPLKRMSKLTGRVLKSIDYVAVQKRRIENMRLYHQALGDKNTLPLTAKLTAAAHTYPFMADNAEAVRQNLFSKGVYPFQYWKKVLARVDSQTFEYALSENIIGLPMDQRYTEEDIKKVIAIVKG
jgi:hypothetical protein